MEGRINESDWHIVTTWSDEPSVTTGRSAPPATWPDRSPNQWLLTVRCNSLFTTAVLSLTVLACGGSSTPPLERGDAPTPLDSLELVSRAEDVFWGDGPRRYQLYVFRYERDPSGVIVTLYPTNQNQRGGGGIVRVNHDASAEVLHRFH